MRTPVNILYKTFNCMAKYYLNYKLKRKLIVHRHYFTSMWRLLHDLFQPK